VASRIRLPTRILGDIPLGLGFLLGADCLNASLFGDIPLDFRIFSTTA
jgi:hypothetical protein